MLGCVPAPVVDEDAGYWPARAERAEMLVAELRADKAGLTERVAELAGQVRADRLAGEDHPDRAAAALPAAVFSSGARDGLRDAAQAGAEGPVHRRVPGAAGV